MRKQESGTTYIEFEHGDEDRVPSVIDLEIDWVLTPGRPASRTEQEEQPELEVVEIRVDGPSGTVPCPDDLFDAFATDQDAVRRLKESAEEQIRDMAEMAADDAAHAAMEPDL